MSSLVEEPKNEGMFFPRTNTEIEDKAREKAEEEERKKAVAAAAPTRAARADCSLEVSGAWPAALAALAPTFFVSRTRRIAVQHAGLLPVLKKVRWLPLCRSAHTTHKAAKSLTAYES